MGAKSNLKGKVGERELAGRLRRVWPEARRSFGQSRRGGEVADVPVPGWWLEGKRHKAPSVTAALAQAIRESEGSGMTPAAVCRGDRSKVGWTVTLRLDDWLDLVIRIRELEERCGELE